MLLGKAYNVCIVSPYDWSDIADELQIANNVLNNWNRKNANNKKRFFFFNTLCDIDGRDYDKLKNPDLLIALFLTKSGTPIQKSNNESIKKCIEERSENGQTTLVYFIEKNAGKDLDNSERLEQNYFKNNISQIAKGFCSNTSEENFEFDLTCDICAFDNFNNTTSIEFGVVDIKVKNSEKQDNKYDLEYLATFLVNSPERPITYRDHVSTKSGTIETKFDLITDGGYECHSLLDKQEIVEYEVTPRKENKDKDELFFTGNIKIIGRNKEKGRTKFGFHIPYNAKYLIINVEFLDALHPDACSLDAYWNWKEKEDESKKLNDKLYNGSNTYIFKTENAKKDSDIIFEMVEENGKKVR